MTIIFVLSVVIGTFIVGAVIALPAVPFRQLRAGHYRSPIVSWMSRRRWPRSST
jgi:hypothetical protein